MSARFHLRRADGKVYMRRRGIECRWFGVYIHKFTASDPGVDLHSHPWWFGSVVLWGGYIEERCPTFAACYVADNAERQEAQLERQGFMTHIPRGQVSQRGWLSWKTMRLDEAHRITDLNSNPTWTLVIRGPRRQKWGFYEPDGFVGHKDYSTNRRDMWTEAA